MNASHPLPGARIRRVRLARPPRRAPLEPRAARRFAVALACLGISYALAWIELPLGQIAPAPAESAGAVPTALAAALTARALVGLLYALVALRYAWARWVTVLLGFGSVVFVAPLLPGEWSTYPLAALVTGLGLAGKLVAAVLLTLPLRTKIGARS
ncbi:hypothetical protein [Trinickia sp.]|uniref:hypothetical protein n=1 Tax=Trinickia sp. TaxID=2571163 RepID=UPI003F7CDE91